MDKYGLIGFPLGHSVSPFIHENLFKIKKLENEYKLYEIEQENFNNNVEKLLKELNGFNVTIPYKTDIIELLDDLDDKARLFGAVNTVSIKDGRACGFNTDCIGFLRALESTGIKLEGSVLLCGSGGVARMIAFECCLAKCELTIAVRESDIPFAKQIKKEIKEKLDEDVSVILLDDVINAYNIVINATPLGMHPNVNASVLKRETIARCGSAFDVVYNPQQTLFLQYAAEANMKNSGGLEMLIWQAAAAQEIWRDVNFTREDISSIKDKIQKEIEL